MPDRSNLSQDERERYRIMDEIEGNRDQRVRRAFEEAGHDGNGPAGWGRIDPRERRRPDPDPRRGDPGPRREEGEGRGWWQRARDEAASWLGDEEADERRRRIDHRGRGPKGYRRSDARIEEDVNDRLTDDPHLDATEIQVAVSNGEVTLTGTVDSRAARRRAEDIAESVSGVTYVMNNLRVRQAGTSGAVG